ncbi:hypothetical protein JOF29_000425 [Kribbella aluminosa]|uniref:DUF4383 domain-containing protein n=1 Tax=Kribbella aluminosa TaxID=416017 RepID=A0ABS4UCH7_9ACTN|nr:DUF6220 domain-containing protein [Kribbella aluminosa]MBP2349342.1 hypothetical protein [Kribbella aluminosa]
MRAAYRVLAGLVAIGVVLQAMFIAWGFFAVDKDISGGAVIDKNSSTPAGLSLHGTFGLMIIPIIALLLLIVSFFAKVDGGIKWALYVLGLVVLQIVLAFAAFGAPVVGVLHGANALALLAVAGLAGRRAGRTPAATESSTTTA